MNDGSGKAPVHLWIVGIVSLVWNAFGCAIYTLTMLRHPLALEGADPAMVAAIEASPAWANGAWGLGVWAALGGSILLLLRRRSAFPVFALSLLGLIVVGGYEWASRMPVNIPQTVAIWLIALFLLWYSRRAAASGVLR